MDFLQAVTSTVRHIHPLLTDFPAAFLPISVVLNLLSRRWPNFRQPAWITMIIGTVGAILAAITGDATAEMLADPQRALVQPHQIFAVLTTLIFIVLIVWQWQARRKNKDVMDSTAFKVLSVIGMVLLIVTGMFGGSLVFDHGVGVKPVP
ncbi:MAG TPA: DUF2231 domain-containing protein [Anaerolineaceae bacterium]|nr:DUF2231 domain-containing protein [Anaerolineaceae bacterium]HOV06469.1 DUF2231 domain-containing protein [Anaerolineaceae bacterium]